MDSLDLLVFVAALVEGIGIYFAIYFGLRSLIKFAIREYFANKK